ncbi:MAG: ADOP family duplicated permease [Gemmatimonadales bacterium]
MAWLPDKYHALRELLRRGDPDPDIRDELAHHLAERITENRAAGMDQEAAEREARQRLGDLEHYRRETGRIDRGEWGRRRRRERWRDLWLGLRRAALSLRRAPAFSLTVVLTLGLAMAGLTASFALLDAVVLRPLRYPGSDRLVRIYHPVPGVGADARWNISSAELFYFDREARYLDEVAIYQLNRVGLSGDDGKTKLVNGALISAKLLDLVGARALVGRLLVPEDSYAEAPRVAVLGERLWRQRFGADPAVVGKIVRFEGLELEVVGVASVGADLPDWPTDVWVAYPLDPKAPAYNTHVYRAVARLADGATLEQAEDELLGFVARYPEIFPTAYNAHFMESYGFTVSLVPWRDDVIGAAGKTLWLVFGAVGLVLAIACFNVASLFLVRGQDREAEVGIRVALGAGRWQLIGQQLAESLLLAGLSAAVGLAVSAAILPAFIGAVAEGPSHAGDPILPRLAEVGVDGATVLFALVVALVAALVFGVGPALARRGDAGRLLGKARGASLSRAAVRARSTLVVGQVSLAVVLLASAGLLLRTVQRLSAVDPGFEPEGLFAMDVAVPFNRYQSYDKTTQFWSALVEQVRAVPGVENAAVGSELPLEAGDGCSLLAGEGQDPSEKAACLPSATVSPGYFATLGATVVGREATWGEATGATAGALVSGRLAKRLWGDRDPLGQGIKVDGVPRPPFFPVTGVVRGLRFHSLELDEPEIGFYPLRPLPDTWLWQPPARMALLVRASGVSLGDLTRAVERIGSGLDPEAVVANARAMTSVVGQSMQRVRLTGVLLTLAALVALALAAIGLYGVIAQLVLRRTREIGIRIALGAEAARVRRQVVAEAVRLAAVGAVVGGAVAIVATRALRSLLFGVEPGNPVVVGLAIAILLMAAFVAGLVPARRASRVDPMEALRAE